MSEFFNELMNKSGWGFALELCRLLIDVLVLGWAMWKGLSRVRWTPSMLFPLTRKVKKKNGGAAAVLGWPAMVGDVALLAPCMLCGFRLADGEPTLKEVDRKVQNLTEEKKRDRKWRRKVQKLVPELEDL
jgi:hypothetical protein